MNIKQQAFVEEYLRCWNATEAARLVGYKYPNRQGPRLLVNVGIKEKIQQRINEIAMSANEVLLRLAEQARADISDFVCEDGSIDWDKVRENGRTIRKITHRKDEHSVIELYSSQRSLELLGKSHGLFSDRLEISGGPDPIRIEGIDNWLKRLTQRPIDSPESSQEE